jgi:hypothetical protein
MIVKLGPDGQDWTVYLAQLPTNGSPKRETEVTSGYWRRESGKGFATPVATWFEDGMICASIAGADAIDPDCGDDWYRFASDTWPMLKAFDQEAYTVAIDTGAWPDGVPTRLPDREAIGGNNPPEGSVEALLADAADAVEKAEALVKGGPAKTQKAADMAANVAKELTETKAKIIAAHKVEKDPWLDGGRAVDAKFFPLRDKLADNAAALKSKVNLPFLQEQKRIADEAAAKARREAEAAEAAGRPAAPPPSEPVKVTSGSRGRKVSLIDRKYGEIVDHEAFGAWLGKRKHPTIIAGMETAANALARNPMYSDGDEPAPGMRVITKQEAV